MPITIDNPQLNEQQIDMIRLLKNPLPEEYFRELRRLVVKLLSQQLDSTVDKWEKDNNISADYYEELSKKHLRRPDKK